MSGCKPVSGTLAQAYSCNSSCYSLVNPFNCSPPWSRAFTDEYDVTMVLVGITPDINIWVQCFLAASQSSSWAVGAGRLCAPCASLQGLCSTSDCLWLAPGKPFPTKTPNKETSLFYTCKLLVLFGGGEGGCVCFFGAWCFGVFFEVSFGIFWRFWGFCWFGTFLFCSLMPSPSPLFPNPDLYHSLCHWIGRVYKEQRFLKHQLCSFRWPSSNSTGPPALMQLLLSLI